MDSYDHRVESGENEVPCDIRVESCDIGVVSCDYIVEIRRHLYYVKQSHDSHYY